MKYPLLILLSFLLFGSCNDQSQKEEKKDQVIVECQRILKEWNIKANISKKTDSNSTLISIELLSPEISHKDHASIIISCLLAKHKFLPKTPNISLNISSIINNIAAPLNEVKYSQDNIDFLVNLYKDAPLLRMNEYCIMNFESSTAKELEVLMAKNNDLERWAIEGSFYQLIYQFFKEVKGYEKGNNATQTMFFLYLTTSDFLKGSELEYHSEHIKNLWGILRNEDIKDYEKQFNDIIDGL